MDVGAIIIVCCGLYLICGCGMVLFNIDTDYPILTLIFWPVALVIRLIKEIIELIGDIRDGILW